MRLRKYGIFLNNRLTEKMKIFHKYLLILLFAFIPFFSFSQEYAEGASPIIDSTWFHKPQFAVHYNDDVITFTKIDSIVYNESPVQDNSLTFDRSFIKKRKDSLVILMKPKKLAFVDDSTRDKRYGTCEYRGFLKNLKIHLVQVLGWESTLYFAIHENGKLDTLWFAGITPTTSNNRLIGYQLQGNYFQVCVDTFDAKKNKFTEEWDFSFKPEKLYAFKWLNENEFLAVVSEHHKRKYFYKVSFSED
jgi:hypothetical protein